MCRSWGEGVTHPGNAPVVPAVGGYPGGRRKETVMTAWWGLLGLVGLVGCVGLLRGRRASDDPLGRYPEAREPARPNADAAHTPLMTPAVTPEMLAARGREDGRAPDSGSVAGEIPAPREVAEPRVPAAAMPGAGGSPSQPKAPAAPRPSPPERPEGAAKPELPPSRESAGSAPARPNAKRSASPREAAAAPQTSAPARPDAEPEQPSQPAPTPPDSADKKSPASLLHGLVGKARRLLQRR